MESDRISPMHSAFVVGSRHLDLFLSTSLGRLERKLGEIELQHGGKWKHSRKSCEDGPRHLHLLSSSLFLLPVLSTSSNELLQKGKRKGVRVGQVKMECKTMCETTGALRIIGFCSPRQNLCTVTYIYLHKYTYICIGTHICITHMHIPFRENTSLKYYY